MVFSSLLSDDFQEEVAKKMWSWLRPGGSILSYDFIYNNPKNKNVSGVSVRRIQQLFPEGNLECQKATLAPPISRFLSRRNELAYKLLNKFSVLRTHAVCWVKKER